MRKPPLKAVESIANYCLNSECQRCYFSVDENNVISCGLSKIKQPYKWTKLIKSNKKEKS